MITEVSIKHRGFHLLSIVRFSLDQGNLLLEQKTNWVASQDNTIIQVSKDIKGFTMLSRLVAGKPIIRDAGMQRPQH